MLKLLLRKFTFNFMPFAVTITLVNMLVYVAGQQIYRNSANDPQIEIANRFAAMLNSGLNPAQVAVGPTVDMETSLSMHISIFDSAGNLVASTARVKNKIPIPPAGVFKTAKQDGQDAFTWQPDAGVRCAAVALPYTRGTLIVGKSLRLAEQRIDKLGAIVLLAWALINIIVAATITVVIYFQFNVLRNVN